MSARHLSEQWGDLTLGVRGVLFDVDGTLYSQPPLRFWMAAELGRAGLRAPGRIRDTVRILSAFRRIREELRDEGDAASPGLDRLQFERPAEHLGRSVAAVEAVVDEWIMRRPLRHLARVRRPGLPELLQLLVSRGLRVGALSDYPTDAKLRALGVAEYFSLGLCTTHPAINAFKPHPKGFRVACAHWALSPQEVLYVGDRPETDGAGAAAAGLRCVIVGGGHAPTDRGCDATIISAFADLSHAFSLGN